MKNKIITFVLLFILIFSAFAIAQLEMKPKLIEKNFGKLKINKPMATVEFKDNILSYHPTIETHVSSGFGFVSIDSKKFPELNKPATITFKNICFSETVIAEHNGEWDPSVEVVQSGLCEYKIDVPYWSNWTLQETAFTAGTHNDTTLRSGNLEKGADAIVIWEMEDNSSSVDDTSYSGDDDLDLNIPTENSSCKYGTNCLYFDGTNDKITTDAKPFYSNKFTISAWVYPSDDTNGVIFSLDGNQYNLGYYTNNRFHFIYQNSTGTAKTVSDFSFTYDEWQHIVASVEQIGDNVNVTLYRDGVLENNDLNTDGWYSTYGNTAIIGASGSTHSTGIVECVQYFNDTYLTINDVIALNNSATCDETLYAPTNTWKLDEWENPVEDNAKQYDHSGQNNLTKTGTTQETGDCKYGNGCYYFSGEDDTDYFNGEDYDNGGYPTVCAWARIDGGKASGHAIYDSQYDHSISKNGTRMRIYRAEDSDLTEFYFSVSNGTSGTEQYIDLSALGHPITLGEWYHLCGNYNGSFINYYFNGEYVGNDAVTDHGELGISSYYPRIGERKGSGYTPLNGSTQCVQYWNYPVEDLYDDINNSASCNENWFEIIDSSDGTFTSTCTIGDNCPTAKSNCKYSGVCSYFNNDDSYIQISNDSDEIRGKDFLTVSAWINKDAVSTDFIVGSHQGGSYLWQLRATSEKKIEFTLRNESADFDTATTDNTFEAGEWVHVGGVYNGSNLVAYLRGEETKGAASGGTIWDAETDLWLGGRNSGGIQDPFGGKVECLQFWDKALTSSQMAELNNSEICNESYQDANNTWKLDQFPQHTWKLEPAALDMPVFPTTNVSDNGGTYALDFDGVNGFGTVALNHDWSAMTELSISAWINHKGSDDDQTIFESHANDVILWLRSANELSFYIDGLSDANTQGGTVPPNEWTYVTGVWNGTHKIVYINGVEQNNELSTGSPEYAAGVSARVGKDGTANTDYFNGSIDDIQITNRTLTQTEITDIYNNGRKLYYNSEDNYYITYNATDYDDEIEENVWETLTANGTTTYTTIYYRAGDCPSPTGAWSTATQLGNLFTFGAGAQGDCVDIDAVLGGNADVTDSISNWTISATKYLRPGATVEDIQGGANTTIDINGSSVYLLNDSDLGELIITWYVNNVNVWNETFSSLTNGTNSTSVLSNTYFVKDDLVHFRAVPYNSIVTGYINHSSNITIGNADFTYTTKPTNNVTYQLEKLLKQKFQVSVTDVDNDVVVRWYVDGTLKQTGEATFTLNSRDYIDYDLFDVTANMSDGEFEYTNTWNVEILPQELNIIGSIAITLFILFVTGGLFILPLVKNFSKNEFVNLLIKRGFWIVATYLMVLNSAIMATIAEASGLDLTGEMFRYMIIFGWAGYVLMGFTVLKTLFDVLKMWKIKKQKDRMDGF